jgi:hypothetical protein
MMFLNSPDSLTHPVYIKTEILGLNPTGSWIFVCCECRVLSGRGLCDELITRPEDSYRLCCVVVCDLETSGVGALYIYIYDISHLRVNWRRLPGRSCSFRRRFTFDSSSTVSWWIV